jgi:hypothetical protein
MITIQDRAAIHALLMEHANLTRRDAALVMLGLASAGGSRHAAMIAAQALTRAQSQPTGDDSDEPCAVCSATDTRPGTEAVLAG